ncbi:MAG: hypothetical protein ABR899_01630 [Candidatus Krumholzibacteriaceae bacterium]|jgi:hypothetical protein
MEKHITAVGALRIGFGIVGFILAGLILLLTIGPGLIAQMTAGNDIALGVLTAIGVPIAFFVVVLSAADVIGGIGVLKRRNWARYLVMIHCVLDIFNIPIGTALGIYCIWVLMQDETARLFTQPKQ